MATWQQGDYTLAIRWFPVVDDIENGELVLGTDPVLGVAVVTQTCDIVNTAPGKEHVVVCPLVEISQASLEGVKKGRTLAAAALEHPPAPNVVVDIGRMTSLHKSILGKLILQRRDGFSTDAERMKFADMLERKFGRFAFPDAFNDYVMAKLRDRIFGAHGKPTSEHGRAYRSIRTMRVTAAPDWVAPGKKLVMFHFVLEPEAKREATREQIARTLDEHLSKLVWPAGFVAARPLYQLVATEEMQVSEWLVSQPIDWDFLSSPNELPG